jgi:hypothetical protein
MAMYLAGTPVFSIVLIGWWSSKEFSHGIISSKMLEVQSFKHIQNPTTTIPMESIVGDSYSLLIG